MATCSLPGEPSLVSVVQALHLDVTLLSRLSLLQLKEPPTQEFSEQRTDVQASLGLFLEAFSPKRSRGDGGKFYYVALTVFRANLDQFLHQSANWRRFCAYHPFAIRASKIRQT